LDVLAPGPFQVQLHLFLDDGGFREVVLDVSGDAQAAEGEGKQSPGPG
jgi:hypothetical protein